MFNEAVITWLQQFSVPWLDTFFLMVSSLGAERLYLLLLTFIYWCINRRSGRVLLIAFLASVWLNSLLKDAVGMARPSIELVRVMSHEWSSGFPSGHAQMATTVWAYLALRWRRRWITVVAAILVVSVSLSRLYLGMHYPGQILAGIALGLCFALLGMWLEKRSRGWFQDSHWCTAGLVALAYLMAIPIQSDDGFRLSGVALGVLLTDVTRRRTDPVDPAERRVLQFPTAVLAGRALLGWVGLFASYALIRRFVAPGIPAMLAYAALATWVTAGAPKLFHFLRLDRPQEEYRPNHAKGDGRRYPIPAVVPLPAGQGDRPLAPPALVAALCLLLAVGLSLSSLEPNGRLGDSEGSRVSSTLPFLEFEQPVLVIAHKGGAGLAPENTLVAFARGLEEGAGLLELDVRRTLEGQVVVIHDDTVDAVTDGKGLVKSYTLADLGNLDAGFNFTTDGETFPFRGQGVRIPTLEAVLKAFPEAQFNIDMKEHEPEMPQALLSVLDAASARDRVIVASFDGPTIRRFRQLAPDVATALSVDEVTKFVTMSRLGLGVFFNPAGRYMQIPERQGAIQLATPSTFRLAHRLGMEVHVWTVNDPTAMRRLVDGGVHGVITDYPNRLMDILCGREN